MRGRVLVDGDQVIFLPAFTPAVVMVQPGRIAGTGKASIGGKAVCVAGDESDVKVPGCLYMTPSFPVPGSGTLKIAALGADQQGTKTGSDRKKLLLEGSLFDANFEVQAPAQLITPGGPQTDPAKSYSGKGRFMAGNATVQAD